MSECEHRPIYSKYLALLILFISSISIPLTSSAALTTKTTTTKQRINLQLKWKHAFQFAGYYAALEKGFYQQAGLDVQILEHNGIQAPVDVLMEGDADFAITGSDVLVSRTQGKPVVALAAIFQHSPYALIVLESSKITRFEDLKGKKIMLNNGYQDAILNASFKRAGIEKQYTQVENSFNLNDLITGKVDAFSAYVTDQGFRLKERGYDYKYLLPTQFGVDFYGDVLTTSEAMIKERPDIVEAFREASIKGWEYALNHHEEIIKLILEKYNTQELTHRHLDYEANAMREFIQPLLVNIGYMHYERWNHIKNIFIETGIIQPDSSIKGLIYQSDHQHSEFYRIIKENWPILLLILLLSISLLFMLIISHMRRAIDKKTIEIKSQEENYKRIFNRAPLGIWVMNNEQSTIEVNQKMTEILGYTEEEFLGKSPYEMVDEENTQIIKTQLERIPVTDHRYYEAAFKHKKGHNIPLRINGMSLRNNAYDLIASLAFVEDVSHEKQMRDQIEQSELQLRTLIDAEPACVNTFDRELRFLTINKSGLEMLGADSFNSIIHADITQIIDEEYRQPFTDVANRVLQGENGKLIFKITAFNGKKIWMESHFVPLRDNSHKINQILAVTHDVTERIKLEQEAYTEKAFLQSVIDGISDSVMVINVDYTVRLINAAASRNKVSSNSN